jgi:hypothetical protein
MLPAGLQMSLSSNAFLRGHWQHTGVARHLANIAKPITVKKIQ